MKQDREKAPVQDTTSKEEIIKDQIREELREMDKPPEPTSQAVNVFCFIIGAVIAFFSITNIIENFEIYSVMLILTGPVALIMIIYGITELEPVKRKRKAELQKMVRQFNDRRS